MRILWLRTAPLHPLDSDDKQFTYELLKALKEEHHVTALSLVPEATAQETLAAGSEYATTCIWIPTKQTAEGSLGYRAQQVCNLLYGSAAPFSISQFTHLAMEEKIVEQVHADKHDVLICESLIPADSVINVEHAVKIPAILLLHHSESDLPASASSAGIIGTFFQRNQHQRIVEFEEQASRAFDGVVTSTPAVSQALKKHYRLNNLLDCTTDNPATTATEFISAISALGKKLAQEKEPSSTT